MNVTVDVCFACKAEMASVKSFCAFCCILNAQTVSLSFSVVSKKVAFFFLFFFMHRQFEIGRFKIV